MANWHRLWIFFVIVALGLVLSWSLIGHKTGRMEVGAILATETPCRPYQAPCAAFGSEMALVLGPGPGTDLLLKAAGQPLPQLLKVDILAAGQKVPQPVAVEALAAGIWRLHLTTPDIPHQGKLHIVLRGSSIRAVFPLAPQ